jgi:spore coat polysaccharide biosynthesis protein SpsF (cytidylyltransferase family)
MDSIKHVCIGIQARSSSKRFPRKVFEMIGDKPLLKHVIDACDKSAFYLNRHTYQSKIRVSYAVLCPTKDEILHGFSQCAMIIEGPEDDVLSRYVLMANKLEADYIVRVTGDCPLLPHYLISKHIKLAVINEYDYCSNVDEKTRTAIDGHDVEVMSRRALQWADQNATDPSLREHVTQILRSNQIPPDFKMSTVINFLNQSHVKLSVDTIEDLERVRVEYERVMIPTARAENLFGRKRVHKF